MAWLPDIKLGSFEARDLANLVVGMLAVILAWRAIVMAKRQEELTRRQGALAEEQSAITKRQQQISDKQYELQEAERQRKANLQMLIAAESDLNPDVYRIAIANRGTRTANGCFWVLSYPKELEDMITVDVPAEAISSSVKAASRLKPEGMDWVAIERFTPIALFPGTDTLVARFRLRAGFERKRFSMFGTVVFEDGKFPTDEYAASLTLP